LKIGEIYQKVSKITLIYSRKTKFSQFLSKNSEILPVKKTLKGICFVREDLCSGLGYKPVLVWSGM
jgi:hypothetical protein